MFFRTILYLTEHAILNSRRNLIFVFFFIFFCSAAHAEQYQINAEFFKAVQNGDLKKTEELIKQGAEVTGEFKTPPLAYVIVNNDLKMVKLLFKYGAPVEDEWLIAVKEVEILDYLLSKGFDANKACVCPKEPKHTGCAIDVYIAQGRADLVKVLLLRGVKPHNNSFFNPLDVAMFQAPPNLEIIENLIKYGVDVNAPFSDGKTLLIYALCSEYPIMPKVVALLLKNGADPLVRDPSGDSPLKIAVSCNSSSLKILLNDERVIPYAEYCAFMDWNNRQLLKM